MEERNKLIYLDNAATTRVIPEVREAMEPFFSEFYGNPSAIYHFAGEAKQAVDHAREILAKGIGAKPEEIYFTGGKHAPEEVIEQLGSQGNSGSLC